VRVEQTVAIAIQLSRLGVGGREFRILPITSGFSESAEGILLIETLPTSFLVGWKGAARLDFQRRLKEYSSRSFTGVQTVFLYFFGEGESRGLLGPDQGAPACKQAPSWPPPISGEETLT
jgi:hypothetical protein